MQLWGHFGNQLQLLQNYYTLHSVNLFEKNFFKKELTFLLWKIVLRD